MINVLKKKYPKYGKFNVSVGQKITDAAKENNVPNEYGIYLIYEGFDCNGGIDLYRSLRDYSI